MTRPPDEAILFHGEVLSRKDIEKHTFPVGCKFHYKNASYNDTFTVLSTRKDPGAEYRQIIGAVAGEVWMLLSSLQKEAALGTVTYIQSQPVVQPVVAKPEKKSVKKAKKKAK